MIAARARHPNLPGSDAYRLSAKSAFSVVAARLSGLACRNAWRAVWGREEQARPRVLTRAQGERGGGRASRCGKERVTVWFLAKTPALQPCRNGPKMAWVAGAAEFWLGKPVIALNTATYWHALRTNGIADKVAGFGRLLAEF